MTKKYESYILRQDLRQILRMFWDRTIPMIAMAGALICLPGILIFMTMKARTWIPEAASADTKLPATIICIILGGIIAIGLFSICACVAAVMAYIDMSRQGYADDSSYSVLRLIFKSDKLPRDKSRNADLQELLLALWLCMNENIGNIEFNPGILPQGKVEVSAWNDSENHVETFMLPTTSRILEYKLGDDKQKQVWLARRPIRKAG